ncbi:hypothetical protein, partial [Actinoplanes philippinensis]|uniref:hypothetical protein n=1 Tax=Actinoplanes philippinensis TaxID=35752 RepID=UPI00340DDB5C
GEITEDDILVKKPFTADALLTAVDLFHHPMFRLPTAPEEQFLRQVTIGEGHRLYTWDAETATGTVSMMVVAQSVTIVKRLVPH